MLSSGINLVPALDVLTRDEQMAPLAGTLIRQVERGRPLSKALAAESGSCPPTLIVLIEIGENTGCLAKSVLQAADWMREDLDLVRQMKSSLSYPLFVFAVACSLALMLFMTVVPKLLLVVTDLGADLPWPTRLVSGICWVLTEPFFWLLGASLVCFACGALVAVETRKRVTALIVRTALELPLLGNTLTTYYMVRFCCGLSVLVENGVNILESVSLAQRLSGHPDLIEDEVPLRERVQGGQSLGQAMAGRPDLYPSLVVSFVLMGEESARLAEALDKVGTFLHTALQERLHGFRQALEPILTLSIGGLVALVMLATLLPLYSIVTKLG